MVVLGRASSILMDRTAVTCKLYRIVRVLYLFVVTSDRHSVNSIINPNPVSSRYYQTSLNTHSIRVHDTIFTCLLRSIHYIHRSRKYNVMYNIY
jgi:hypothetical protein